MTEREILLDLLDDFAVQVRRVLNDTPPEALYWQPDADANSIGITAWHFGRALDLLKVRILENRPPDQELWHTQGWVQRTGYDPRGIGYCGFGSLGGYTRAEVEAVPRLAGGDLLAYFEQVVNALRVCLREIPGTALDTPAPGWLAELQSGYVCIRRFLMDAREHLGEIKALAAMYRRRWGTREPIQRFSVTLDVDIRLCQREDLNDLEWFGMWTEYRSLINETFAAQERGEQAMLVADVNGFPAGQLWADLVKLRDQSIGVLWALRVLPPLQNLGTGTRLIGAAERLLVQRGFAVAEIGVEKDNPAARRLYERLDYQVVGDNAEEWDHTAPDGRTVHTILDEWILRKGLHEVRA